MEDNVFWLNIWKILVWGIALIVISCMTIDSINQARFVSNGYSRETVKGSGLVQWVKQ